MPPDYNCFVRLQGSAVTDNPFRPLKRVRLLPQNETDCPTPRLLAVLLVMLSVPVAQSSDDTVAFRFDTEDIDTECSCEIAGRGSKSRVNELFPTLPGKFTVPLSVRKVSGNAPANLFTVASVTRC